MKKIFKYQVVEELGHLEEIPKEKFRPRINQIRKNHYKIVIFKNKKEKINSYYCTKCQTWHFVSKGILKKYKRNSVMLCENCKRKLSVIYPHNIIKPLEKYISSIEKNNRNELIVRIYYYLCTYDKKTGLYREGLVEVNRRNLNRGVAVTNNTGMTLNGAIYHITRNTPWREDLRRGYRFYNHERHYYNFYPIRTVIQTPSYLRMLVKNNEMFKYACLDLALKKGYDLDLYIEFYQRNNKAELLLKIGNTKAFDEAIGNRTMWKIFDNLTKKDINFIRKYDPSYLELITFKELQIDDIELIKKATEVGLYRSRKKYRNIRKTVDYLARKNIKGLNVVNYDDYIGWCQLLGMDMKDKRVLYPEDFENAHDQAQRMYTVYKEQLYDKGIQKFAKDLEKYLFKEKGLVIRPVETQKELINESEKLEHCVRTYAERIARRETAIFVIRKKENLNVPYVTLELKKDEVIQCRGFKNNITKPLESNVKIFVNDWCRKFNFRSCFSNV